METRRTIMNSENIGRTTWNVVKNLTNKNKKSENNILKTLKQENSSDLQTLNRANNFFVRACPDLNKNQTLAVPKI